jgi:glycosyltransferase involved in cell wall biosynthesis
VTAEQRPDVSIVVATRNRARRLGRLLDGLRAQTMSSERFELIVVDDGSTDETAKVLDAEMERGELALRIFRRDKRGGPARARNDGWPAARAELVAFTDDDCSPSPGWLEAGVDAARSRSGAIIQGRTEPDPAERHLLGPFSRTVDVREPFPAFQACNVFYPRALLERLGGFDADAFPTVAEDADLAWRAIELGTPTAFASAALTHHAVNHLGPVGKLRLAYGWRSGIGVLARHPDFRRALFAWGPFWKPTHQWLALAALGLLLPRRWWPVRAVLAYPYVRSIYGRARASGTTPLMAPYFMAEDVVEVGAALEGSIRHRTLII